jgi:hypothetical protein
MDEAHVNIERERGAMQWCPDNHERWWASSTHQIPGEGGRLTISLHGRKTVEQRRNCKSRGVGENKKSELFHRFSLIPRVDVEFQSITKDKTGVTTVIETSE